MLGASCTSLLKKRSGALSFFVNRNFSSAVKPLEGIRVLDFSRILAGPYCSMAMADLGAEVIKIEKPGTGDDTRGWGPPFLGEESTYFLSVNRNKKSIALDIKHPDGLAIIKTLVKSCDVVLENFIPGTTAKLGIDYESLKKENDKLIYASISGFGSDGPSSKRRGYDVMLSALGGLMSITGESDGPPVKVGVALTDVITGLWAQSAISSALLHRYKSGEGTFIECSLLDAQLSSLVNIGSAYLNTGAIGKRWGTAHPSIVPYQAFKAKDGFIVLGANNDEQWDRLCNILQVQHLHKDPKFATNAARVANRIELISILQCTLINEKKEHWERLCGEAGLPVCPVNDLKEVFEDPQVIHNEMVHEIERGEKENVKVVSSPLKLNGKRFSAHSAPPDLGEHTSSILRDLLHLSEAEIQKLKKNKVIA